MSDIKKIKPTHKSGFKQSYFEPKNLSKYLGSFPIICRSSWERKFAIFCDTNDAVIKWSSEPIEIKYYNILDKKFHKYYPDYFVQIQKEGNLINKIKSRDYRIARKMGSGNTKSQSHANDKDK